MFVFADPLTFVILHAVSNQKTNLSFENNKQNKNATHTKLVVSTEMYS